MDWQISMYILRYMLLGFNLYSEEFWTTKAKITLNLKLWLERPTCNMLYAQYSRRKYFVVHSNIGLWSCCIKGKFSLWLYWKEDRGLHRKNVKFSLTYLRIMFKPHQMVESLIIMQCWNVSLLPRVLCFFITFFCHGITKETKMPPKKSLRYCI